MSQLEDCISHNIPSMSPIHSAHILLVHSVSVRMNNHLRLTILNMLAGCARAEYHHHHRSSHAGHSICQRLLLLTADTALAAPGHCGKVCAIMTHFRKQYLCLRHSTWCFLHLIFIWGAGKFDWVLLVNVCSFVCDY